jgi:ferredoxin
VGTVVNYLKYINPFRFRIADSCTSCMRCVPVCRYGALSEENIQKRRPGATCTYCGDCISVCKPNSFYYKFPGLKSNSSRKLYLGLTIVLHVVFLALARM